MEFGGQAFHNGLVTEVSSFNTPVGFYLEHFTTNARFSYLHAGPHVKTGLNCEWDDPVWEVVSLPADGRSHLA